MRPLLDMRALKSGGFLISFVRVITEEKKREGKGNDEEEKKALLKKYCLKMTIILRKWNNSLAAIWRNCNCTFQ